MRISDWSADVCSSDLRSSILSLISGMCHAPGWGKDRWRTTLSKDEMTVSPASSPVAASHHDRTLCTALHLPPSSASTPRNTILATRIPPHPILASNAVDEAVVASKGDRKRVV